MGVMRENQITGSETAHPRADLLHAPHAGIAVLDGEAESAPQRGQIEREIRGDLTPIDEHFRSVTDGRDDGPDPHLSWCRFRAGPRADPPGARAGEPDSASHAAGHATSPRGPTRRAARAGEKCETSALTVHDTGWSGARVPRHEPRTDSSPRTETSGGPGRGYRLSPRTARRAARARRGQYPAGAGPARARARGG